VVRLPSLTRAKTLGEYSSAGYLIFALVSLVAIGIFDARAHAVPGLQEAYSTVKDWFIAILRIVHLEDLPIRNAPLTVVGALILIALAIVDKVRQGIGELTADATLAVLSAMIFVSERLIRHRSLSSLILIVLASLLALGLWDLVRGRAESSNADATFAEWLDTVQETVRDTTLSPIDSHRYEMSRKRWESISPKIGPDERLAAGREIVSLVDGLYGAVKGHDMCGDLDHVLALHETPPRNATLLPDLLSRAWQVHHVLLARGYIALVDKDCPGDHEASLVKAAKILEDVTLEPLDPAKDNILNAIYSYAWLLWLPKAPAHAGTVDALCNSLDQCIWKAHSRYTSKAVDDCTYSELRRRNNLSNFLETVAAKDIPGTQSQSMNKWLRRRDSFASELRSSLANLERCQDLARLGGHIAFLTLAQGYAALSTLAPNEADRYVARSAGYFQLPAAMDPDDAFHDPNDILFCKLWNANASSAVFLKELKQPTDHTSDLQQARLDLCSDNGN
jgi:hypothetical protein